jgi:hypothetical protein
VASPSIRRIERLNYGLAALLTIIGALTQPQPIALGLAVGAALTCANFFVLRKLVVKWTADAAAGRTPSTGVLLVPKMMLLMGAVVACLALLPIDAVAFVVGYSLFIASIMIETAIVALGFGGGALRHKDGTDHG